MELYITQIAAIIGLGLSSLIIGLLPGCFSTRAHQRWPLFVSLLICFGGGVLMATSLIHMLPEVRESLYRKQYAEFILCAGFFLVYIIDEIVHFFYSESSGHSHHSHNLHNPVKHVHDTCHRTYGTNENKPLLFGEPSRSLPYNPNYSGVLLMKEQHPYEDPPPSQLCHVGHEEPCRVSPISNIGLLLALSVHSILEGLAVGLQTSNSKVLLLLGAIASHKLVISFCLGIELASTPSTSSCKHFVNIAIFSFGSSVGIAIGMFVHQIPQQMLDITFPILQGLAAGTLLYITVSEILPRERARWHEHHHRRIAGILQLLFVGGGFICMVAIKLYLDNHK